MHRKEGRRGGHWLEDHFKNDKGPINIAELQGTVGSAPANDRHSGLMEVIKNDPNDPTAQNMFLRAVYRQLLVREIDPTGEAAWLGALASGATRTQVAQWTTAGDEGKVWYSGSMASSAKAISSFQITEGSKVLLTASPE